MRPSREEIALCIRDLRARRRQWPANHYRVQRGLALQLCALRRTQRQSGT